MRQSIINMLDVLIWVVGGLIAIVGSGAGIYLLTQGEVQGLGIMLIALIYSVLFMGMFFIVKGIYSNTLRTAEAIEKLASR